MFDGETARERERKEAVMRVRSQAQCHGECEHPQIILFSPLLLVATACGFINAQLKGAPNSTAITRNPSILYACDFIAVSVDLHVFAGCNHSKSCTIAEEIMIVLSFQMLIQSKK